MSKINVPDLHDAVQFLKQLRIQRVETLPHSGNYGLFYKNNEITTGLIHNNEEIKINLLDGSFHYFSLEQGFTFDLTTSEGVNLIKDFIVTKNFKLPKMDLKPVSLDQMTRYREFGSPVSDILELVRMKLMGQYTHIYLWGHNFDFSLVWFTGKEDQQIDIGISPGDGGHEAPYLYVIPRPFKDDLKEIELRIGKWNPQGWNGIIVEWEEMLLKSQSEIVKLILELFEIAKKNYY